VDRPLKIYLDTNLWNTLCDHAVDPQTVVTSLAARNADLALGLHAFYELAKTFRTRTRQALERGRHLLSHLKEFLDAGISCVKENEELLAAEMSALKWGTSSIDAFLRAEDYVLLSREVDKLANGGFDERTAKFVEEQSAFASNIRSSQIRRLGSRPDARQTLKNVSPEELDQWLQTEASSPAGSADLKDHILRRFPEATEPEAMEYAIALLASPASRMARGLVRAGSYYVWRCAYRDSVRKDLLDDTFHVLNSVHCDVYATQEKRQEEYAGLLLTASTRVAIYDSQTPLDRWLQGLA
jgi:hypothetical protein